MQNLTVRLMNQKLISSAGLGVAVLASLLFAPAARAVDRAVVIGINQYPRLKNATLQGCVPDAKAMDQLLREKYGFETQVLTNEMATRKGIVAALKAVKPADNFVLFYAGHGESLRNNQAVILPNDAMEASPDNDLPSDELYKLVTEVPAKTRTVLLDSCFSGAMMRDKGLRLGGVEMASRYYDRSASRPIGERPISSASQRSISDPNDSDDTDHLYRGKDLILRSNKEGSTEKGKEDAGVCYFAASRKNERAMECSIDGEHHGIFTYHLIQALSAPSFTRATSRWGDVQPSVGSKVADYTLDVQHPTLSSGFESNKIFGGESVATVPVATSVTTPPAAPPQNYWDYLHTDFVRRDQVQLSMEPRKSTIKVGEEISFSATVTGSGYLIILEKGTSGDVNLLFPLKGLDVEDAAMQAGEVKKIPSKGWHFEPDSPGIERIRALLIGNREIADQIISSFRQAGSRSLSRGDFRGVMEKKLVLKADRETPLYTADIEFQVVPADN